MEFFDVLNKRQAIREFQSRPIEQEKIQRILEEANYAPSAGNLQAYKIYLIKNQVIKEKLAEATLGQDFIVQAPVVLAFCADPQRSARKYGKRGEELYSLQDATIAAVFAWLTAVSLGLGAAWVGAFSDEEVKKILKTPADFRPAVIMPIGYPAEKPEPNPRRPIGDLVEEKN